MIFFSTATLLLSLTYLYLTTYAIPIQNRNKNPADRLKRDIVDMLRFGIVSGTVDSGDIYTDAYMSPTGSGGADFKKVHMLTASRIQMLDDDDMFEINRLTCEPSFSESATDESVMDVMNDARERGVQVMDPLDGDFQLPFELDANQAVLATNIDCRFP